jgi:hypothetical protein
MGPSRTGQRQPSSNTHAAASCPHNIPAGRSVTFTFTPAQVQQELKAAMPIASVDEHITAPVQWENKIAVVLSAD